MMQTYYISAKHVQGHILFRALPHPEHRTRLYRRQTLIRTIAQRQKPNKDTQTKIQTKIRKTFVCTKNQENEKNVLTRKIQL